MKQAAFLRCFLAVDRVLVGKKI